MSAFPMNIEVGDQILVRASVILTNKYAPNNATLEVDCGDGHLITIPLWSAFGIITKINGEKP